MHYRRNVPGTPYHYPGGYQVAFYTSDSTIFHFKPRKEFAIEPFAGSLAPLAELQPAIVREASRHFAWNEIRVVPNKTDYVRMPAYWEGASERIKRLAKADIAILQTSYLVTRAGEPSSTPGGCIVTVDAVTGEVLSSTLLSSGGPPAAKATAFNLKENVGVVEGKGLGRLTLTKDKRFEPGTAVVLAQGPTLVRAQYDAKRNLLCWTSGKERLVGKPNKALTAALKQATAKNKRGFFAIVEACR
ncbi:MAG: hypothetical protein JNJ45_07600 [Chthonomonas sp.]|nr:hypothetical protein [Chthonomonas sp.]